MKLFFLYLLFACLFSGCSNLLLNEKQEAERFYQKRESLLQMGFDQDAQSEDGHRLFVITDQHIYTLTPLENSSILRDILLSDLGKGNKSLSFVVTGNHYFYSEPEGTYPYFYQGYIQFQEGLFSQLENRDLKITYQIPFASFVDDPTGKKEQLTLERDNQILSQFHFKGNHSNTAHKSIKVKVDIQDKYPKKLIQPLILTEDLPSEIQKIEISMLKTNYSKVIFNLLILRPLAIIADIVTSPVQLVLMITFKGFNPIR
ncbi:hypothetical protein I2F27_07300 [Acinetobacter sp. B5B]|uniref:hypothetical protein n=1 Tax=Acinetobacter baretiae TaxID=2605383 RepID=UPI0018C34990|nr:hypothetical protein [Acinetobacter baretiae]MBF7683131.1 hypothetical protein [Acinetobacter baretiae]MBF7684525.1 hypothetical protein [Acinetobacter baretiae]